MVNGLVAVFRKATPLQRSNDAFTRVWAQKAAGQLETPGFRAC